MALTTESELVQLMVDAQRRGGKTEVDPEKLAHIDIPTAYRISLGQTEALGETTNFYKTIFLDTGVGAAGPIYASRVGNSPDYVFPAGFNIKGVEFEIGIELARDIGPDENLSEEEFNKAVSHYFLGIEVVGTRLLPTPTGEKPNPAVQLADHFSALGYVIGAKRPTGGDAFEGKTIIMEIDGKEFHRQAAVHPFTTVTASAVAYAKAQHPGLPLKAGTKLTTGSLNGCVLLPEGTKGVITGRLGDEEPVRFTLP